ncbi:odorant receptor 59b-like, partial [Drosophila montana]|uniref:odorant receptor 59b-like n=1 Tax=Drosophila montana TaxID=40370 RepID=UPI00313E90EE
LRPVMSCTIFIQFLLIGFVLGLTLINILYFSGLFRGLSSAIFFASVLRPIKFIAGGIFPISLSNNVKMAKFAFSVMTIVQEMNLADRFK